MATQVETANNNMIAPAEPESNEMNESKHEISSDDGSSDKKSEKTSGSKRPVPAAELDDDKKAERRAANRRSAFQSRQRRKILIDDLQRTVAALSKDNGDLRRALDEMRVQLEATLLENHQLRMQHQLGGMAAMGNPAAALFGAQALQQAQAQALLRGAGANPLLAQLLAAAGGGAAPALGAAAPAPPPVAPAPTQNTTTEASQESSSAVAPAQDASKKEDSGIQGILNAASMASSQDPNAVVLQQLLQQNPSLATDVSQQGVLLGLLEKLRGTPAPGPASSGSNISEALKAMLRNKN